MRLYRTTIQMTNSIRVEDRKTAGELGKIMIPWATIDGIGLTTINDALQLHAKQIENTLKEQWVTDIPVEKSIHSRVLRLTTSIMASKRCTLVELVES
jgi:hypothetical protein